MDTTGAGFDDALEEAQALGYAEADPTADIEGFDAAAKAAILASLAFHTRVTARRRPPRGHHRGDRDRHRLGPRDGLCGEARSRSASWTRRADSVVSARVHPAMIPRTPPAGQRAGRLQRGLRGERGGRPADVLRPGAGGAPTASAVLGDLVTVARNRLQGVPGAGESTYTQRAVRPMGDSDDPLPRVARRGRQAPACWRRWPSCSPSTTCRSRPSARRAAASDAQLVVVTHTATDAALSATVDGLREMDIVRDVSVGDAGRRASRMTQNIGLHQWRGVIEEYRDRLPVIDETPVVTLARGRHAAGGRAWLSRADRLRGLAQGRGQQPDRLVQGPRHDGGDLARPRRPVPRPSSARRPATPRPRRRRTPSRAGLTPSCWCRRAGSRRQDGAGRRARRHRSCRSTAGSTTACDRRASSAKDYPVALVNSVNPVRLEGQKTAAFEIVRRARRRPGPARAAGRQRGQHRGVLEGLPSSTPTDERRHADARGCGVSRPRARRRSCAAQVVREAGDRRRPRSGSATRPPGRWPRRRATSPAG